jgi:cell pole-organizing protein PopZ
VTGLAGYQCVNVFRKKVISGRDDHKRRQRNSQMSSSEQASEPTMDEILASIRKIISDDGPGAEGAPQPEAAAPEPAAPAGDGLAEDLANALNDTPAPVEEPDDILDLTQIVEGHPQAAEPQTEAPQGDALQAVLGDMPEEPAAPEPMPAPEVAQGDQGENVGDVNIEALLAEAGVQDTVVEAPSEPQAPSGDDLSAMIGHLDDSAAPEAEEASISEALSAMTPLDDTAAPEAEEASISEALSAMTPQADEPVAEAALDAAMAEIAMPEVEAAAAAPVEAGLNAGELTPEVIEQAAPVAESPELADIPEVPDVSEAVAEAPIQEDASFEISEEVMADATQIAEPVSEPEVPVEAAALAAVIEEPVAAESPEPAEEQVSKEVVEVAPASSEGKTLEDSVKDLLRPMLREWLDDNMERIVQSEVASGDLDKS